MNERKIVISGIVTDFDNNPLQGALVEIKNDHFEAVYKAHTNDKGEYRILVEKSVYLALVAYKDYKTKYLEYWAWNVPAYEDSQISPRIGEIEVYAMNAFPASGSLPINTHILSPNESQAISYHGGCQSHEGIGCH